MGNSRLYSSRKRKASLAMTRRWCLPYGYWINSSGAKIYHNRQYVQLYHQHPNGFVEVPADPYAYVDIVDRHYYFDDSCRPFEPKTAAERRLLKHLLDVLAELGHPFDYWLDRERVPEQPWRPSFKRER